MAKSPCCSKDGLRRGPWSSKEDALLKNYVQQYGEGQWRTLPKKAGLMRCGKSCRLRWMNYLRPGIKRGNISNDEEDLILRLHKLLGNRWSLIAGRLPGRTDNEIKNYWNTYLSKKVHNNNNDNSPLAKPNKSTQEKKQKQKKNATPTEKNEVEKIKVYAPKAMRVSSEFRFIDDEQYTVSSRTMTSSDAAEKAETDTCLPMALADLKYFPLDDGIFSWDHFPPPPPGPLHHDLDMFDIFYHEFSQLL